MTISTFTPEQAWAMTLDQMRQEMPNAAFETWVSSAQFVSFHVGILTIGAHIS